MDTSHRIESKRGLLVLSAVLLLGVWGAVWYLARDDAGATVVGEPTGIESAATLASSDALRAPNELPERPSGSTDRRKTLGAGEALVATRAADPTADANALTIRVEGVPGLPSGRCVVSARYDAAGARLEPSVSSFISTSGEALVPPYAGTEESEATGVSFRLITGPPGFSFRSDIDLPGSMTLALVGALDSRSRFAIEEADGLVLRPEQELVGVCLTDETGAILWSEPLSYRGPVGFSSTRGVGWLAFARVAFEELDLLRLAVRKTLYSLPTDLYPVSGDGLVRIPFADLSSWGRELIVHSNTPLPPSAQLRIERETRGEYRPYEVGKRGVPVLSLERSETGWSTTKIPPGRYRVTLDLAGNAHDGEWYVGEADLVHATRVVLEVPPFEYRRRLTLRLDFADDLEQRGMQPWRVRLDPEREGANWMPCDGEVLKLDWLGPLPTSARITGATGPQHPGELPLSWGEDGLGVLDLSNEVLRRCLIDAPEDGTQLIAQELTHVQIGGPPAAIQRTWSLLPAKGALWELCWWEGADFDLPLLERDTAQWRASESTVLYDSLTPQRLAGLDRFVPRRLPGHSERVAVLAQDRGNLIAFVWLATGVPDDERVAASSAELMKDGDWLYLGLESFDRRAELVVPPQANGLLLIDQSARKRAYLVRGAWGTELQLEHLDWR